MKKILFSLTVFLISASILTGCFFPLGDLDKLQDELSSWQDEMSRLMESYADMSWPEYSYPEYSYPDYSYPHQSDSTEYSEPYENSEYNEPSHDVPEISYPEISEEESQPEIGEESVPTEAIAELYTLDEVRDFLNRKKAEDIFDIQFIYKGDKSELDGATIARITSSCVIYHTIIGNKYDVTLVEYPGDRIVDAYFSGDQSELNSDEKRALRTAVKMVEEAKEKANSKIELEAILHDMLAEKITYYGGTTDVPDSRNPPRHLTAIGALLDGKANCQGYTDGFYVLASIAGFEVGRMNVYNSDGWHILNTVFLDGQWYGVDVTFNDCMVNGTEYIPSYRLFNVGKDRMLEYFWGSEMEYYTLASRCDEKYFYFMPEDESISGYQMAYTDINVMAQDIIDRWLDDKQGMQYVMLVDSVSDWQTLSTAMENSDYRNQRIVWTIWTYTNGRDTFFTVKLS